MPTIRVYGAPVRDEDTGEPNVALVGKPITIVTRGTTTPFPIQDGAGDPIPDSALIVQATFVLPVFDFVSDSPTSVYLDWYDDVSGRTGPIIFDEVSREVALEAASSAASSAAAAQTALADLQAYIAANPGGGGGTMDHNALANLTTGDPHTQYLTLARGTSAFYPRATVDSNIATAQAAAIAAAIQRGNHTGTQGIATITGLQAALDAAGGGSSPTAVHVMIVVTGTEARPEGAAMVIWRDARVDQSTPPTNMGENDLWVPGAGVAGTDLEAPSVPTGLTTGSITASSVTLSWASSTDNVAVTRYEVRRNGSISLGIHPTTPTATTRVVTGLSPSTAGTLEVRAGDAAGNWSAWSASAPFTTSASSDTANPTVPTGLAASAISSSGATVTWGAGTDNVGVTGYDWRLNGGSPTTVAADPRSLVLTGLTAETAHTVGIRSRDAAGNVSAYVDLVVNTLAASADTYSVYGTGAPTGTWTWGTDGTPYIVTARGFLCSEAGARAVGGRAWIPTAASGALPSEATFYLFGPDANPDTAPVETKVVATSGATAGSWVEAMFDTPEAMGAGECWMIGVRFTGAGDAGKYSYAANARANSNHVASSGPLGEGLVWAAASGATANLSSRYKIGTGSSSNPGDFVQSYGVDIIVDLGA